MSFLQDPAIWLLISFLVFSGVLWKFGKNAFVSMLDNRIQSIRDEIKLAENLRVEAQEMLAQYQRKQRDAEKEAEKIIAQAEKQADDIRKKAEADLSETVDRREKQLQDRLARLRDNAKEDIRQYAATLALEATYQIIDKKLDKTANANLVDQAIQGLSAHLG